MNLFSLLHCSVVKVGQYVYKVAKHSFECFASFSFQQSDKLESSLPKLRAPVEERNRPINFSRLEFTCIK